jgi:hypothetical protein
MVRVTENEHPIGAQTERQGDVGPVRLLRASRNAPTELIF